jgi:hypothetical protein
MEEQLWAGFLRICSAVKNRYMNVALYHLLLPNIL